jgi:hypothetical protein
MTSDADPIESSVDEADPMWWHLAYFHEAGHAVAARRRGRPVNEIYIHPEQGFTGHGSFDTDYKDDDHQVIVWAGPWAEVRALWAFNQIDTADDFAGSSFADTVRRFLRKNASDWLEYHRAMGRDYDKSHSDQAYAADWSPVGNGVLPAEDPPDASWDALLREMWPATRLLGLMMLQGETVISVGDDRLHRVGPHRWLRPLP